MYTLQVTNTNRINIIVWYLFHSFKILHLVIINLNTIFQCDIIIDQIYGVKIVSRTRELYLDDPPETLEIQANDDEGKNNFTKLKYHNKTKCLIGWCWSGISGSFPAYFPFIFRRKSGLLIALLCVLEDRGKDQRRSLTRY